VADPETRRKLMNTNSYYGLDDSVDYGILVFGSITRDEVAAEAKLEGLTVEQYTEKCVREVAKVSDESGEWRESVSELLSDWLGE
jgi:hypothetical protein